MKKIRSISWVSSAFLFCYLISGFLNPCFAQAEKVSKPGLYRGYSEEKYDWCSRESIYVPMPSDGTRLAIGKSKSHGVLFPFWQVR